MKGTLKYLAGIAGASGYGSNSTAEQVTQHCSCLFPSQLTAILTGATSGIGAETARVLAKRGVRIIIPARNLKRANEFKEKIQKETPDSEIMVLEIDLSSFDSIQRFCSEFLSLGLPLNILVNNAGKFSQNLEFSEDKVEMTFATNYLGHFLLTELLLDKMIETAKNTGIEGRIINVSSVIHSWVKRETVCFSKITNPKSYNGTRAYAHSKLANILHAKEIAAQLEARNARVTINSVHPGIVKTGIFRDHNAFITVGMPSIGPRVTGCKNMTRNRNKNAPLERNHGDHSLFFLASRLLKTTSQGAATTCYVALSQEVEGVSGKHFADCNESNCSSLASDQILAHKFWKQSHAFIRRRLDQNVTLY